MDPQYSIRTNINPSQHNNWKVSKSLLVWCQILAPAILNLSTRSFSNPSRYNHKIQEFFVCQITQGQRILQFPLVAVPRYPINQIQYFRNIGLNYFCRWKMPTPPFPHWAHAIPFWHSIQSFAYEPQKLYLTFFWSQPICWDQFDLPWTQKLHSFALQRVQR